MKNILYFLCIFTFYSNILYPMRSADAIQSVTLQSDGKIIAAGYAIIDGIKQFTLVRINTNGTIDTTFGSPFIDTIIGTEAQINSVKVQTDGKIVAAGYARISNQINAVIVRYNSDGTLDNTFGTGGIVQALVGAGVVINDLELQTDGKLVIAGYTVINGIQQALLARFNTDGTVDTTFGSGGVVTSLVNSRIYIEGLALQTDGKIVVSATTEIDSNGQVRVLVARYNTNGTLDATFNGTGVTPQIGTFARAHDVAIQADGKIVLVGSSDNDFAFVRYNSNGTLDTTFSGDGVMIVTAPNSVDIAQSVAIQSDGKIVAAGFSDRNAVLVRLNTDGSLDATYGDGGIVISTAGSQVGINEIVLQSDDKVVAGGFIDNRAAVARYTTSGMLDTTFAGNGFVVSPGPVFILDGELQFNAFAMANDASINPDTKFNTVYSTTAPLFALYAWALPPTASGQDPVCLQWSIPDNLDPFAPVQLDLHILAANTGATGTSAIQVWSDFKNNGGDIGSDAGGFENSFISSTFDVAAPTGHNLKQGLVTIPLPQSNILGQQFAFLAFSRTGPASGTEYPDNLYLSSLAIRYKKTGN